MARFLLGGGTNPTASPHQPGAHHDQQILLQRYMSLVQFSYKKRYIYLFVSPHLCSGSSWKNVRLGTGIGPVRHFVRPGLVLIQFVPTTVCPNKISLYFGSGMLLLWLELWLIRTLIV